MEEWAFKEVSYVIKYIEFIQLLYSFHYTFLLSFSSPSLHSSLSHPTIFSTPTNTSHSLQYSQLQVPFHYAKPHHLLLSSIYAHPCSYFSTPTPTSDPLFLFTFNRTLILLIFILNLPNNNRSSPTMSRKP